MRVEAAMTSHRSRWLVHKDGGVLAIGSLPVPPNQILSYLKAREWDQLPAEVQSCSDGYWKTQRGKTKITDWALPVNETEWRYIQKCWSQQSPRLVLINSKDQLLTDVAQITGDNSANGGVDCGASFDFALDITGVSPDDIHIESLYNETRRHLLFAKSCLRQIQVLKGRIPEVVVDDFADLEITLDEFFMAPHQTKHE
jgi:hypothetical protein